MNAQIAGNPHYEGLSIFNNKSMTIPELSFMQAQATLALAYEQRTANLIAFLQHADGENTASYISVWDAIVTRLGLNEGATK